MFGWLICCLCYLWFFFLLLLSVIFSRSRFHQFMVWFIITSFWKLSFFLLLRLNILVMLAIVSPVSLLWFVYSSVCLYGFDSFNTSLLLSLVLKRRKLPRFGNVTRPDSLSNAILQGTQGSGRRRGRQRICRMDNVKEWTSLPMPELLTTSSCRKEWKSISEESSIMPPSPPPDDPTSQGTEMNWTELNWTCSRLTPS